MVVVLTRVQLVFKSIFSLFTYAMERFTRTRTFLGEQRFTMLQKSHVTIVGLGAVGGYAMEALVRAGIGKMTLVDFDRIQISNINRQLLATELSIGQAKVNAAKARATSINSAININALNIFAAKESLDDIFMSKPDILIDAIDSMNPKVQLLTGAIERQITTFSSMGAALRSDPAKIKSGDLSETTCCPLAKRVRKMLRRHSGIESGITCVYSTEKVDFEYTQAAPDENELPVEFSDRGRQRNVLGSLPTITGIFGLTLANLAIMHLSNFHRER